MLAWLASRRAAPGFRGPNPWPAAAQEALWRASAFADAGADMLFIDALGSKEEMRALCQLGGAAAGLPKVPPATSCDVETSQLSETHIRNM